MEYQALLSISREQATDYLSSESEERAVEALLRLAFNDQDWRWVQDLCLDYLKSSRSALRYTAAICLGHLARIHQVLDYEIVIPALTSMAERDSNGADPVREALADIYISLREYPKDVTISHHEIVGQTKGEKGIVIMFYLTNGAVRCCGIESLRDIYETGETLPKSRVQVYERLSGAVAFSRITEDAINEFIDHVKKENNIFLYTSPC